MSYHFFPGSWTSSLALSPEPCFLRAVNKCMHCKGNTSMVCVGINLRVLLEKEKHLELLYWHNFFTVQDLVLVWGFFPPPKKQACNKSCWFEIK